MEITNFTEYFSKTSKSFLPTFWEVCVCAKVRVLWEGVAMMKPVMSLFSLDWVRSYHTVEGQVSIDSRKKQRQREKIKQEMKSETLDRKGITGNRTERTIQ